jgi:hypothetical protein
MRSDEDLIHDLGPSGGCRYADARALKSLSIASAPVVRTGRSSRLYTTSVVLELAWPASLAISSTGTPELDISDTNE